MTRNRFNSDATAAAILLMCALFTAGAAFGFCLGLWVLQ
jgi:hypothetical protein